MVSDIEIIINFLPKTDWVELLPAIEIDSSFIKKRVNVYQFILNVKKFIFRLYSLLKIYFKFFKYSKLN